MRNIFQVVVGIGEITSIVPSIVPALIIVQRARSKVYGIIDYDFHYWLPYC